jgi:hypothetical protein
LQTLPDWQFAHMRHAQIARRAIVPQWLNADLQKMSLTSTPNQKHQPARPALIWGRITIVTNVEHGMRWTRQVSAQSLRGRLKLTRTAKAYGPGLATLRLSRVR